jgi:hypothetical protein
MKGSRYSLSALLLGIGVLFASCADSTPVSPPAPAAPVAVQGSLLGGVLSTTTNTLNTGLLSCRPLAYASATQSIGPTGGVIRVGPHRFEVPAGALPHAVAITATIVPGTVNRVHFEPAGLEFGRSAALTMSYANCDTLGSLLPKRIAYVADDLSILYYLLSLDDLRNRTVTGEVDHFSDYVLAW